MPPSDPLPPARRPRDAGMSLVEVMVAFTLFAVMATAVIVTVTSAARITSEDAARSAAVNLAVRELEIVRDTFSGPTRGPDRVVINRVVNPSPLPGGTVGEPLVVDGTRFTVVRTAQWAAVGSAAASACDEGSTSELAYLRVEVQVRWPELGDRVPVTMETVMTPPKGTYSALNGHIGLKVLDHLGRPVDGVPVTARSTSTGVTRSGTTAADGCVLLAFLDAGTYSVTLNRSGHVNPAGDPAATTTAQVQQGQLWRGTVEYDEAASLTVTFETLVGHDVPPGIAVPVSLGNSALQPFGFRAIAGTGRTRVLERLWPYPSGYQVWAGACVANDPGDALEAPVGAAPGGSQAATAYLAPLQVNTAGGRTVTARQARDNGCTSDVTVNLGVVPAGGQLRTSLPYGRWTLTRSGSTTQTSVTLAPTPVTDPPTDPLPPPVVIVP